MRAAGPMTMSASPATSSASTTHDIPALSALLNETVIECAVAVPDGDGLGDGDFDGDADGEALGVGDFDGAGLPLPVWLSTL